MDRDTLQTRYGPPSWFPYYNNHIVIVSVFASSAVDRGFEPQPGQTTDY